MIQALVALLARFSLFPALLVTGTAAMLSVAVAGSAVLMNPVGAEQQPRSALAVLTSPIEVDAEWTVDRVTYRLAETPTSIAAISFRLVAPQTQPAAVAVQAIHPAGAHYRCSMAPAGADVTVTCPTGAPELPVSKANRLYIEVRG